MNLLVPLAALLGIEVEAITERVRNTIILNAIMVVLGLAGVAFLVAAGYIALADWLGPLYAALIFAGSFLVLALAVYLGSRIGEGRRRREIAEKRRSTETSAFVTTAAITALPVMLRSPTLRTLGLPAAAIAAYLLLRGDGKRSDD
jgi:ABC-type Na+ efflux pump permease subunit